MTNINHLSVIVKGLITGLEDIHELKIAHRDIKPENIMINVDTWDIKYIDFGVSCHLCDVYDVAGTLHYIAPAFISHNVLQGELFTGTLSNFKQWAAADIWSLGLTIMELISLQPISELCFKQYSSSIDPKNLIPKEDLFEQYYEKQYKTAGVLDCVENIILSKLKGPIKNYLSTIAHDMLQVNPDNRHM